MSVTQFATAMEKNINHSKKNLQLIISSTHIPISMIEFNYICQYLQSLEPINLIGLSRIIIENR